MTEDRRLIFIGRSYEELRSLPKFAQREIGYDLERVQSGKDPRDWKPMSGIGPGVREIRIRDASGAYRAIYIAKFDEAVFVLHCFEKKSQKTSRPDIETAIERYRSVLNRRL